MGKSATKAQRRIRNRSRRAEATPREMEEVLYYYRRRIFPVAQIKAEALTREYPGHLFGWKALGTCLMEDGRPEQALAPFERALAIAPGDAETHTNLGKAYHHLGREAEAQQHYARAVEIDPRAFQAYYRLGRLCYDRGDHEAAHRHLDAALAIRPDEVKALILKANAHAAQRDFEASLAINRNLVELAPDNAHVHNNIANLYSVTGEFEQAERHYRRALELNPGMMPAFSNAYFTKHYNPGYGLADFFGISRQWQHRFAPDPAPDRPRTDPAPDKRLRVGLLSGGFRNHPVGVMITPALENTPPEEIEYVVYATKPQSDNITNRIRRVASLWRDVAHVSQRRLAEVIREDGIDILIDMSGHSEGNRLATLAREPAPLIVKWVGGLVGTTGLDAVDYLISDTVETPAGVDPYYHEKLIRLPDDYVCYLPPAYAPAPAPLPALENGYVTLGCCNNPAKLNPVLLEQWARLLHELPDSRLLLKGGQFGSDSFRAKIHGELGRHGVDSERVILEGPCKHRALLETYHRVDIALDPWPYSGGLTTCEALLMGVPVVTLPGPSFAGRHSATHLVNAGLPELVVDDWETYRARVRELARDPDTLATIRAGLRETLLRSPVCDGGRFGGHFAAAMRAIWQRHCEDRPPAALSLDTEGRARFEDDDVPLTLARPGTGDDTRPFDWSLPGRIVVIDNGGKLVRDDGFSRLMALDALDVIAFDPAGRITSPERFANRADIQVFPQATLGDGRAGTLYACLDPALSGTLRPVPDGGTGTRVLAELPVQTVALDAIEGLPGVDWLILDDRNDTAAILAHGERALANTLLIEARVRFSATHAGQPDPDAIESRLAGHGFRLHRLNGLAPHGRRPSARGSGPGDAFPGQDAVDALFIPDDRRLASLDDGRRNKLAFLLHTVYGDRESAHEILRAAAAERAERYLRAQRPSPARPAADGDRQPAAAHRPADRKLFVVGFPKSGTSTLQKALHASGVATAHWQVRKGFVGELMYRGLRDQDDPWFHLQAYQALTQADVCLPEEGVNYWPNLDLELIDRLRQRHPDCLFVLNHRDPRKIVDSIRRWPSLRERLVRADIPGLPPGVGDDDAELEHWIEAHYARMRERFRGDASFVEIDIEDPDAPRALERALGIELGWWGIRNVNRRTPPPPSGKKTTGDIVIPERPHMSDAEAALFDSLLARSSRYFEFGSGGSTVWAARRGLTVHGVESDRGWVDALKNELGESCRVDVVDIGPTREWGYPVSAACRDRFPAYSRAIETHDTAFDLILVDGRFRVACTLAAVGHILGRGNDPADARIFIHDFWNRPHYRKVLDFLEEETSADSAGVFRLRPRIDRRSLREAWREYACNPA